MKAQQDEVLENINSSENGLFNPQGSGFSAADHAHTPKEYTQEMDDYTANHQKEENETLHER